MLKPADWNLDIEPVNELRLLLEGAERIAEEYRKDVKEAERVMDKIERIIQEMSASDPS